MMEIMTAVAEINLMAGVTSFRDLGGPLEDQRELRRDIEAGKKKGPRLFLAGPTVRQRGAEEKGSDPYAVATLEDVRRVVAELAEKDVDQIWSEGFWERDLLQALADAAHDAGLGIDLGVRHVAMVRTAVDAGVDRLHALFTADALSDYSEEDLRRLIRGEKPIALGPSGNILRGPYVAPSLEMREAYARALRFPEILEHPRFKRQFAPDLYAYLVETWRSPQSIPWGIGSAERMEVARSKVRRFIEAGGREQLLAGTDAGSPLNFHPSVPREIANLVAAGLSPMEAIQSATLRPAQMQGVDDQLGTLSAGKIADLIVVDGFPLDDIRVLQDEPVHVIKNGVRYR
jgi:imidazolonepropionase-like amidohydrolase